MSELRILVIDDETRPQERIERALRKIGVTVKSTLLSPREADLEKPLLGMAPLDAVSLDSFDLALVDLELEGTFRGPQSPIQYLASDLKGGSEILPHLRIEAPWLPVIGYSKLFDHQIKSFLAVTGSFGFDGVLQRTVFEEKWLTFELWDLVVRQAKLARLKAVLGAAFDSSRSPQPEIRCPVGLEAELQTRGSGWRELIANVFHFADAVTLEPLTPGYSGSVVMRATVSTKNEAGSRTGTWVVKLDTRRSALWIECRAHLRLLRAGVPLARSVPLLWNSVVTIDEWAALVYQLATDTKDAALYAQEAGIAVTMERVGKVVTEFHLSASRAYHPLGQILVGTVAAQGRVDQAAKELGGWALGVEWLSVRSNQSSKFLDRTVAISAGLIHGDLHLRNVLLGERDVLIDFALAKSGPIVYDVARLVLDLALASSTQFAEVKEISSSDPTIASLTGDLLVGLIHETDDASVYDLCLQLCFAQAFTYPSTEPGVRSEIGHLLTRTPLPRG